MKDGSPDGDADKWSVVDAGGVNVYVPVDKEYEDGIPRITRIRFRSEPWLAVSNEKE